MVSWKRRTFLPALVAGALGCLLSAGAPAPARAAAPERATLVLPWYHQAQFAGYYVAREKGFYARRGLEVNIRRGGSDVDARRLMDEGTADFSVTLLSTALEYREAGLPLVHLAQVFNRSNFMLVAWKDRGIRRPADLRGRRVSLWRTDFEAPYAWFFRRYGVTPEIVPQYYSVNLFLRHGVDACAAMTYNEYHTILQSGVNPDELTAFRMWEHGFDFPEDGLYALDRTVRARPAACRALVAGSLEGWDFARQHTDETLGIVMDYLHRDHVPSNRAHMRWMLREVLASIYPGPGDRWKTGELSAAAYTRAAQLMLEQGRIRAVTPFAEFHREIPREP